MQRTNTDSCIHTVEYEITPRCKLTKFVIMDFSEISYSKKTILKVNILMTGIILQTFIIPD